MSSITIPVKANDHPHIRPLNVLRDLSAVADLIELCFSSTMDNDGQRYLSDMRRASRDDSFLNWASHMAETASMPMTGYVWEQDGRIVGNSSLIPFRDHGKRVYLIANVATHPDYRRHGIGRALTERAMIQARAKMPPRSGCTSGRTTLVRSRFMRSWGFRKSPAVLPGMPVPSASSPDPKPRSPLCRVIPASGLSNINWLHRLYPDPLSWYHSWNLNALRPGFWNSLYLLFMDFQLKQWAAVRGDELLATLTWMPQGGRPKSLYAAIATLAQRRRNIRMARR